MSSNKKTCDKCGAIIDRESAFCSKCGNKVASEKVIKKQKESKKKLIVAVVIAVAVFSIGGFEVVQAISHNTKLNPQTVITPSYFSNEPFFWEAKYSSSFRDYQYNMYESLRTSILEICCYNNNVGDGMSRVMPSPQLDQKIANWVNDNCTFDWFIKQSKHFGSETAGDCKSLNFDQVTPYTTRIVNFDLNEQNFQTVPYTEIINNTPGNNIDKVADSQQIFIFPSDISAQNFKILCQSDQ